jgi:hypothetical protein
VSPVAFVIVKGSPELKRTIVAASIPRSGRGPALSGIWPWPITVRLWRRSESRGNSTRAGSIVSPDGSMRMRRSNSKALVAVAVACCSV